MIDIRACDGLIEIGRQRENDYRRVLFNMGDVLGQYPDATFVVLNRRSADMTAYAVPVSQISVEGTDVCWVLKASDLAYIGDGECEVIAYSGNTVAKDEIYTVRVLAALDEGMDPPDPSWEEYLADLSAIADRAETAETGAAADALKAEGYAIGRQNGEPVDQESPYYHGHAAYFAGEAGVSAATAAGSAGEAAGSASAAGRSAGSAAGSAAAAETAQIKAETAQDAAEAAQAAAESARDQITGMTAEATTLDPGESATASYSDGVLSLGIPRGADGQDGADGKDGRDGTDGISPTASVSKSGTTATITITDKTGTTTAEISDGEDGQDGAPGQDGYTPQRGTDYWTAEDKEEILSEAEAEFSEDISDITNDLSLVKDDIDGKAPVILQTASGDVVSISDGADGMPMSAVVSVEPVQDLHGQANPYPAGGGKNLFDVDKIVPFNSNAAVSKSGGSFTVTNGNSYGAAMFCDSTGHIYTFPVSDGAYAISISEATTVDIVVYGSTDGTNYSWLANGITGGNTSATFTVSGQTFIQFRASAPANGSATIKNFMFESGSTATAYAPYSNICPITGWTGAQIGVSGKNLLFDYSAVGGYGMTGSVIANSGGGIRFSGVPTWTTGANRAFKIADVTNVKKRFVDVASVKVFCDSPYCTVKSAFFSTNDNRIVVNTDTVATTDNINVDFYIMVYIGEEPTEFAPYIGTTYPISWQTAAGTVYGGTVDTGTGVLTVTRAMQDLGQLTWTYNSAGLNAFTSNGIASVVKGGNDILCSVYRILDVPLTTSSIQNNNRFIRINKYANGTSETGNYSVGVIVIKDTDYTDTNTFTAAMSGQYLCYELTTPVTYQLDPVQITTLFGQNHIWADTGAISVEYAADTKAYIAEVTDPDGNVVAVSGSTPSITGESGKRYICGTVDSISITPPQTGIIDVVFSSGTTPTVLTASGVTWPGWFNPNSLSASTVYDICIKDGYGVVITWT